MNNKLEESFDNLIDFIIPLHRYHYLVITVIQALNKLYSPKIIYIITPNKYCEIIKKMSIKYSIKNVIPIPEETFFILNYQLSYNDIYNLFNQEKNILSREFGWWYQQIIKLSAFTQIANLSDPYIVWDSDLIPLIKWDIYPTKEEPYFKFAILQEKSKNDWIIEEYKKSLLHLNLDICNPQIGTFVPHHFIFYHNILRSLKSYIEKNNGYIESWIEIIISLSHKYFRFSEYRTVSSFIMQTNPDLLKWHEYELFGKYGERIREPLIFLEELNNFVGEVDEIPYNNFIEFVKEKYKVFPSYLQIEHI
jgi:hypothetical protein